MAQRPLLGDTPSESNLARWGGLPVDCGEGLQVGIDVGSDRRSHASIPGCLRAGRKNSVVREASPSRARSARSTFGRSRSLSRSGPPAARPTDGRSACAWNPLRLWTGLGPVASPPPHVRTVTEWIASSGLGFQSQPVQALAASVGRTSEFRSADGLGVSCGYDYASNHFASKVDLSRSLVSSCTS